MHLSTYHSGLLSRHQEQAPGILRVLRRHNSVCLFAASLVLDSKPGQERFQCVVQLLRLALWLKKKGCYDTVFALHDGLHSPAVKRLDTCWAMVDRVPGYAEMRAQIQRLCSPANDFDKYRTEVAEVSHHRGLVYDFFVCYDLYISPESLMDKICYEVFYDFGTMSFLKMYRAIRIEVVVEDVQVHITPGLLISMPVVFVDVSAKRIEVFVIPCT
ncbi:hypothetical protein SARC_04327 [Sphaeroforma arctica JP610]|uniref:Ras-GEF domain-containing protein n=1 Tax=Sphaeroforma arctica JP610 TaxID=667725 RepID=A0A0L0G2V4_9EUKA|nr:hypothetical protein SARC_04327 [Sphaeroforma arctica JP610]KNC83410.1 hypothetical protein SARC_04327 [Sphaeroforma arctica JP610]|eukprot:XP_014157312.1 hypothetical protein SARC_04327 [Sphaeroforma arctica JP610]